MSHIDRPSESDDRVVTQAQMKRERLRFVDFKFWRTPQGACNAEVELEWLDGMRVQGKATGTSSDAAISLPVSDGSRASISIVFCTIGCRALGARVALAEAG